MAIIPKLYADAVVAIGVRNGGNISWIGTGFFLKRKVNSQGDALPFLVTNRHVFERKSSIVIKMKNRETEQLQEIDANILLENQPIYKLHPNKKIDIAVLPLNGGSIERGNLAFPAFDIDESAMTSEELIQSGVDAGSLVYMLGFPLGLVNRNSNLPICRLGCIARLSETQIRESHNILLDIQNFPGNSGSPIVSRLEFVTIEGTPCLNKCVLMGIVHSYIPYQERLINMQTKQIVEVRSENSGIANMHPVEYIREIIDEIQPRFQPDTE